MSDIHGDVIEDDDDPLPEPPRSWRILIVSAAEAAAVLVGAAVYIGLDLRSANRTTAEREAADAARPAPNPDPLPSGVEVCPGGCAASQLPATLADWTSRLPRTVVLETREPPRRTARRRWTRRWPSSW
ncbi:hypothetical protein [Dactylosporangium sp. NPDC049140]|uniref:hypothetical protein n=1 Tax=Dactylosporangium sp. NPDC049140 TaxID=3155647 RepID=UPI0033D02014